MNRTLSLRRAAMLAAIAIVSALSALESSAHEGHDHTLHLAWTEGVDGVFSTDFDAPSEIQVQAGTNVITATIAGPANIDLFRFTVPVGSKVDSIRLAAYTSTDPVSWIGLQSGTAWTAGDDIDKMIAQQHFGTANIGAALLDVSSAAPLPAGTYTVRAQQLGEPADYRLELELSSPDVPAPEADSIRPSFRIGSATRVRSATYVLRGTASDNLRPVKVQFRVKAPGKQLFGKWTEATLKGGGKTRSWASPKILLSKLGEYKIEVVAFDAAENASARQTFVLKRVRRTTL